MSLRRSSGFAACRFASLPVCRKKPKNSSNLRTFQRLRFLKFRSKRGSPAFFCLRTCRPTTLRKFFSFLQNFSGKSGKSGAARDNPVGQLLKFGILLGNLNILIGSLKILINILTFLISGCKVKTSERRAWE